MMCKNLLIIVFLIFVFVIFVADGAEPSKKKNRYRNKKTKANCHLKELDKCIKSLEKYKNDTNAYKLITNDRGLDEICSNSQASLTCFGGHIENCGTPIQKEMFDFMTEQFTKSIDKFCKPGDLRREFLQYSPCIAEKVLNSTEFKTKCNNPYLAAIGKVEKLDNLDERLDLTCCSYNRWESCAFNLTEKACNGTGRENLYNFLNQAFAGLSNLFCKQDDFDFLGNRCVSLYPVNDTATEASKNSTNPITKYLTSYFGFFLTS
ncbi:uncharacterized protein LOC141854174 [Brevipalpus obovatus]|uniref:uncharacterized protein LOC141854174 n=1 Tax=Brevipalpus obovatus TaxID=246614 RepID=UPI003D9EFBD5